MSTASPKRDGLSTSTKVPDKVLALLKEVRGKHVVQSPDIDAKTAAELKPLIFAEHVKTPVLLEISADFRHMYLRAKEVQSKAIMSSKTIPGPLQKALRKALAELIAGQEKHKETLHQKALLLHKTRMRLLAELQRYIDKTKKVNDGLLAERAKSQAEHDALHSDSRNMHTQVEEVLASLHTTKRDDATRQFCGHLVAMMVQGALLQVVHNEKLVIAREHKAVHQALAAQKLESAQASMISGGSDAMVAHAKEEVQQQEAAQCADVLTRQHTNVKNFVVQLVLQSLIDRAVYASSAAYFQRCTEELEKEKMITEVLTASMKKNGGELAAVDGFYLRREAKRNVASVFSGLLANVWQQIMEREVILIKQSVPPSKCSPLFPALGEEGIVCVARLASSFHLASSASPQPPPSPKQELAASKSLTGLKSQKCSAAREPVAWCVPDTPKQEVVVRGSTVRVKKASGNVMSFHRVYIKTDDNEIAPDDPARMPSKERRAGQDTFEDIEVEGGDEKMEEEEETPTCNKLLFDEVGVAAVDSVMAHSGVTLMGIGPVGAGKTQALFGHPPDLFDEDEEDVLSKEKPARKTWLGDSPILVCDSIHDAHSRLAERDCGLVWQNCSQLFRRIREKRTFIGQFQYKCAVRVSIFEVYEQQLCDLLLEVYSSHPLFILPALNMTGVQKLQKVFPLPLPDDINSVMRIQHRKHEIAVGKPVPRMAFQFDKVLSIEVTDVRVLHRLIYHCLQHRHVAENHLSINSSRGDMVIRLTVSQTYSNLVPSTLQLPDVLPDECEDPSAVSRELAPHLVFPTTGPAGEAPGSITRTISSVLHMVDPAGLQPSSYSIYGRGSKHTEEKLPVQQRMEVPVIMFRLGVMMKLLKNIKANSLSTNKKQQKYLPYRDSPLMEYLYTSQALLSNEDKNELLVKGEEGATVESSGDGDALTTSVNTDAYGGDSEGENHATKPTAASSSVSRPFLSSSHPSSAYELPSADLVDASGLVERVSISSRVILISFVDAATVSEQMMEQGLVALRYASSLKVKVKRKKERNKVMPLLTGMEPRFEFVSPGKGEMSSKENVPVDRRAAHEATLKTEIGNLSKHMTHHLLTLMEEADSMQLQLGEAVKRLQIASSKYRSNKTDCQRTEKKDNEDITFNVEKYTAEEKELNLRLTSLQQQQSSLNSTQLQVHELLQTKAKLESKVNYQANYPADVHELHVQQLGQVRSELAGLLATTAGHKQAVADLKSKVAAQRKINNSFLAQYAAQQAVKHVIGKAWESVCKEHARQLRHDQHHSSAAAGGTMSSGKAGKERNQRGRQFPPWSVYSQRGESGLARPISRLTSTQNIPLGRVRTAAGAQNGAQDRPHTAPVTSSSSSSSSASTVDHFQVCLADRSAEREVGREREQAEPEGWFGDAADANDDNSRSSINPNASHLGSFARAESGRPATTESSSSAVDVGENTEWAMAKRRILESRQRRLYQNYQQPQKQQEQQQRPQTVGVRTLGTRLPHQPVELSRPRSQTQAHSRSRPRAVSPPARNGGGSNRVDGSSEGPSSALRHHFPGPSSSRKVHSLPEREREREGSSTRTLLKWTSGLSQSHDQLLTTAPNSTKKAYPNGTILTNYPRRLLTRDVYL